MNYGAPSGGSGGAGGGTGTDLNASLSSSAASGLAGNLANIFGGNSAGGGLKLQGWVVPGIVAALFGVAVLIILRKA